MNALWIFAETLQYERAIADMAGFLGFWFVIAITMLIMAFMFL